MENKCCVAMVSQGFYRTTCNWKAYSVDDLVTGGAPVMHKSTGRACDSGQVQVLFGPESEALLLQQIRSVPLGDYQAEGVRLTKAEESRQFLRRLHHDPQEDDPNPG